MPSSMTCGQLIVDPNEMSSVTVVSFLEIVMDGTKRAGQKVKKSKFQALKIHHSTGRYRLPKGFVNGLALEWLNDYAATAMIQANLLLKAERKFAALVINRCFKVWVREATGEFFPDLEHHFALGVAAAEEAAAEELAAAEEVEVEMQGEAGHQVDGQDAAGQVEQHGDDNFMEDDEIGNLWGNDVGAPEGAFA